MSDYIHIEATPTEQGVEYTVSIPAIRIVDKSNWPDFTIEWMGQLVKCRWLHKDAVQVGDTIWVRPVDK